ncbi:MAG: hypothetical protein KDA32_07635 [Phycisphaerales bacterium]|nr:hypothetical protein [Phycisphaerales bacterium]
MIRPLERGYSTLSTSGEVSIGAFARRQRIRRLALGAFGVALAVIGVFVYRWITIPDVTNPRFGYAVEMRCRVCGHEIRTQVAHSQRFPDVCENCGEMGMDPLWKCLGCGYEFVPKASENVTCPICLSPKVGAAARPHP